LNNEKYHIVLKNKKHKNIRYIVENKTRA